MRRDTGQSTTSALIEKAAFAVWREKGIDNTSISDICGKANISRSTFYRNYKCEGDIISAYLNRLNLHNNISLNEKSLTNKELLRRQLLPLKKNFEMISIIYFSGYRKLFSEILWPNFLSFEKIESLGSFNHNYNKYFLFGGFMLVFMAWAADGDDPEAEEVSLFLCEAFGIDPNKEISSDEIKAFAERTKKTISLSGDVLAKTSH